MTDREQERLDTIQAIWDYLYPFLAAPRKDGGEVATVIYDSFIEPLTTDASTSTGTPGFQGEGHAGVMPSPSPAGADYPSGTPEGALAWLKRRCEEVLASGSTEGSAPHALCNDLLPVIQAGLDASPSAGADWLPLALAAAKQLDNHRSCTCTMCKRAREDLLSIDSAVSQGDVT